MDSLESPTTARLLSYTISKRADELDDIKINRPKELSELDESTKERVDSLSDKPGGNEKAKKLFGTIGMP